MKHLLLSAVLVLTAFVKTAVSAPPIAGETTLGVSVAVVHELAYGWSAKRDVLGKPVYNDQNQKIGKVEDVIIAPDKNVSFMIVSTGGFLGLAKHDVAIPTEQLKKEVVGKIVLAGATKDTLRAMPEFEYAKKGTR